MSLRAIKNQLKMIVSKYISQQETFLQNNNIDGIQLHSIFHLRGKDLFHYPLELLETILSPHILI